MQNQQRLDLAKEQAEINFQYSQRLAEAQQGREKGMNQWKSAHAVDTDVRSLEWGGSLLVRIRKILG